MYVIVVVIEWWYLDDTDLRGDLGATDDSGKGALGHINSTL